MDKTQKRKRTIILAVILFISFFSYYFISSIYLQTNEYNKKEKEIKRLQKNINQLKEDNNQLKDPEYIKNEFRKKYNMVEKNEKIINFPETSK